MTRLKKFPAKIAISFCTLFCLSAPFLFSQEVDTAWVRRYNGPGNGDDKAVAIAVDSGGNVYVTGSSFDNTTGYDFCTIKYLPNGDTAWVRRYNGPANDTDSSRALVLDANSNVYVTGVSHGDFLTIKYDPSGNQLWVQRFHRIFNFYNDDGAFALAVDPNENVYVTGRSRGDEIEPILATVKYDSLGNLLWSQLDYRAQIGSGIALDGNGNAFVTGTDLADFITVKYYPNGDTAWTRQYNGPVYSVDIPRAIAADSSGNAYVTGVSHGDFLTIKYDSLGNQRWVQRFATMFLVSNTGGGHAISLDKDGSIFVTGQAWDIEAMVWFTIKYDSSGNQIWVQQGGMDSRQNFDIAVDSSRSVYVVGGYDIIKYNVQGNTLWRLNFHADANSIALDDNGNIYATGFSFGAGTGNDFLITKYSPLPQLKGDLNLDGVLNMQDVLLASNYAFIGEIPPVAPVACDINCDGKVTAVDVVILLRMVFLSAAPPC